MEIGTQNRIGSESHERFCHWKKREKRHNRYRHTFFRDREIIKGRERKEMTQRRR
jgi:hypothetical protein